MKLLIFDLDFTLVDTTTCQCYLKTTAGREAIVGLINSNEVVTELYFDGIVEYINSLVERFFNSETDTLPIIISDSPSNYCETVLAKHGFDIHPRFVFGAAHKPCVNIDDICQIIPSYNLDDLGPEDFLIIGDSPKDIYFGHELNSPSIWTAWGYSKRDYEYSIELAIPTRKASDLKELICFIEEYIEGGSDVFEYEKPNFKDGFGLLTVNMNDFIEHHVESIGYAKNYVPEAFNTYDSNAINTFFEVHWTVKSAKNIPLYQLMRMTPQYFYKRDGKFAKATDFMRMAGIYKFSFIKWLVEQEIKGKVLLVPVPSSLPVECNKTNIIDLIANLWTKWINISKEYDFELVHKGIIIERFQPKNPTHLGRGERHIQDQLSTMGVFKSCIGKLPADLTAVIFLDDVTTSGKSINAMATIFRELNVVENNIPLYGYVLYKTYHPREEFDFEL